MLLYSEGFSLIMLAILVFNEISHRKREQGLLDRLLEKNGVAPLSESSETEERREIKPPKQVEKLVFHIPGMPAPPKKVGPLGNER